MEIELPVEVFGLGRCVYGSGSLLLLAGWLECNPVGKRRNDKSGRLGIRGNLSVGIRPMDNREYATLAQA